MGLYPTVSKINGNYRTVNRNQRYCKIKLAQFWGHFLGHRVEEEYLFRQKQKQNASKRFKQGY